MELQNTTSTLGYSPPAQNMYHVLDMGDDNNSATDIMVTTQVATVATGTMATSLLGQGTAAGSFHPGLLAAINQSIAPAFNQVVQNQLVLQSQITAILLVHPPPVQALPAFMVPPIQQVAFFDAAAILAPRAAAAVPAGGRIRSRAEGLFQGGRGVQGGCGRGQGVSQGARQHHPSFATMICNHAGMGPSQGQQGMFTPLNPFGRIGPFAPLVPAQGTTNAPSPVKCFADWNACFSCGFSVTEGHTPHAHLSGASLTIK